MDYYKGLIALRKQLPGLTDKSKDAWKRISGQWKKAGVAGFQVDNSPMDGFQVDNSDEKKQSRWETLFIIYNRNQSAVKAELPAGRWEILADGRNSLRWVKPETISGAAQVDAVSILVLGKGRK